MSNVKNFQILLPVARFVQGSLTEMQDKDNKGRPLVVKKGVNAGQPTKRSFFAGAIPKQPGHTHWAQTDWGLAIWNEGAALWPRGQSAKTDFSWKIEDGDDPTPRGDSERSNASRPGFAGNWIVKFGSGYPPKVVDAKGVAPLPDPTVVKLGHYIEVFAGIASNDSSDTPGIYMNHLAVAYAGWGEEIVLGINTAALGMGQRALPPGASATPMSSASASAPAFAAAALPAGAPPPIPGAAAPAPFAPPPQVAVQPSAPFVASAGAPPPPSAAPAPPAPAAHLHHKGIPIASYRAQGWTDAQLRADGWTG